MAVKKDLGSTLKNHKIQDVRLRKALEVDPQEPLERAIEKMATERLGCVLVAAEGKLVGIFTERDVLTRVIEPGLDLRTPIEKVMTPKPKCLKIEASVSEAIRLMSSGGYRHLPILDPEGQVKGVLSVKGLVNYLAEHFPYEIYNLPPDPHQVQRTPEGA